MERPTCGACGAPLKSPGASCPRCAAGPPPAGNAAPRRAAPVPPRPADANGPETSLDATGDPFVPGAVIDGRYVVVAPLGAGTFGSVFRVRHRLLNKELALKALHPGVAGDPEFRRRFLREARVLMELAHPNIVRLHDVGESQGLLYATMDLCPGQTLASLLRESGRFPAAVACDMVRQVLDALAYAHGRGVVHRDLKPANLMAAPAEHGTWKVHVLDFGLVKVLGSDSSAASQFAAQTGSGFLAKRAADRPPSAEDMARQLTLVLEAARRLRLRRTVLLPGLTALPKNEQGFLEFRHERTGMLLVRLPSGEYLMGGAPAGRAGEVAERRRWVRLSRPFLLGKTPITNAQFRRFRPDHSSGQYKGLSLDQPDHPAVLVNWEDAVAFCDWAGLRLPTEAEWEYAAHGGDQREYPWGNAWPPPAGAGNFSDEAAARAFPSWPSIQAYDDGFAATSPVGSFPANPFGLQDLAGNVWEWCADAYGPELPAGLAVNPAGPEEGDERVMRGGSWLNHQPRKLRAAYRGKQPPDERSGNVGFRAALSTGA
ncbi:MAG: SUMF1/EgtB/PvdO family nonheme iron enzyme [Planctomycetes bacterium]|nr:SUMF1/EgtB/PvdO family nonheme iron enzyme [Planctomycetota bacterium]